MVRVVTGVSPVQPSADRQLPVATSVLDSR